MFVLERNKSRGSADYGWLKTSYSFSFANYFNPLRMGFGALRVFNDDYILAGKGFPTHSHKDMEIVTIVTEGTVLHCDSTGGSGAVSVGEVQVMSAGSGVSHSEFASDDSDLSLYQIWILPREKSLVPSYSQRSFAHFPGLTQLVGGSGLSINQDAAIYLLVLGGVSQDDSSQEISCHEFVLEDGYGLFIFVDSGGVSLSLSSQSEVLELSVRDSICIHEEKKVIINNLDSKESSNAPSKLIIIKVPL